MENQEAWGVGVGISVRTFCIASYLGSEFLPHLRAIFPIIYFLKFSKHFKAIYFEKCAYLRFYFKILFMFNITVRITVRVSVNVNISIPALHTTKLIMLPSMKNATDSPQKIIAASLR
jgi:hypothetical protein